MARPAFDVICITNVPRHTVANALQVQARTDYTDAIRAVRDAFKGAASKVGTVPVDAPMQEFRDAVASAHLQVNHACDSFVESVAAAERLFQKGVDLQSEEPEPPIEEEANA